MFSLIEGMRLVTAHFSLGLFYLLFIWVYMC